VLGTTAATHLSGMPSNQLRNAFKHGIVCEVCTDEYPSLTITRIFRTRGGRQTRPKLCGSPPFKHKYPLCFYPIFLRCAPESRVREQLNEVLFSETIHPPALQAQTPLDEVAGRAPVRIVAAIRCDAYSDLAREPPHKGGNIVDVLQDSTQHGDVKMARAKIGQWPLVQVADDRLGSASHQVQGEIGTGRVQKMSEYLAACTEFQYPSVGWNEASHQFGARIP